MSGLRRVIVGASGSPGNLCALRYAEHLARATGATLIPVHAWIPPGGDLADRRCPSVYLRRVWSEDAWQRLREALGAAWGQLPADLDIKPCVERGEPGPVLTAIAYQPDDALVIGTGRRGTLAHLFSGRVSRHCLAHAQVPLVAIPPPTLASHLRHSPLRWMFWHRPLTPDGVLNDRGKTAALTPPEGKVTDPVVRSR
jgi:nucleotide-binding universal stress UspA family protein